jgi:hypothetical protein
LKTYTAIMYHGSRGPVAFEFRMNRDGFGPSVLGPWTELFGPDAPTVANLPGKLVSIHAPAKIYLGMDWGMIAEGFNVPLTLPAVEPGPRKPKPEPYRQQEMAHADH